MAVTRRTIKFLPSIFQTDANRKFLSSTLDQLVSEPDFRRVNGYVGRKFSPAFSPEDSYVEESNQQRSNYQLEPGITTRESDRTIKTTAGYSDLVSRLGVYGAITNNHDRLFNSEYYSYSPPIDIDKLVNYKNYYWLSSGPEAIKIGSKRVFANTTINFQDNYTYIGTNLTGTERNPKLYLKRGTTYTFNTTMFLGNLYIQSEPGKSGLKQYSYNSSSRQVAGVANNGTATITFTPPLEGAQDSLIRYPVIDHVEYALGISQSLTLLDNSVWNFGEGMSNDLNGDQFYPDNVEVIFVSTNNLTNTDWVDRNGQVVPSNQRTGVFKMSVIKYAGEPARVQFNFIRPVPENTRVLINQGVNKGKEYLSTAGSYIEYNGITGENTVLFYQHSGRDYFGEIELVEPNINYSVNVSAIIGSLNYTTSDGIVFSNGMKVSFDDTVQPADYRNKTYIVEGVGKSISLVDFDRLTLHEILQSVSQISFESKQFDVGNFDETLLGSGIPDYIVVNRDSVDNNAWSRVNRWFHYDVIKTALERNNFPLDFSNFRRAERPIIEFSGGLQLFNNGIYFKQFVDHIFDKDFTYIYQGIANKITDVATTINGARFTDLNNKGIGLRFDQTAIFTTDLNNPKTIYRAATLDQSFTSVFDRIKTNNNLSITGTISLSGSDRVTGTGTEFVNELEIGTNLYLADGNFLGIVKQILSSNDLVLDNISHLVLTNVSGIRVNYAKVNLIPVTSCSQNEIVVIRAGVNAGSTFYLDPLSTWKRAQQKKTLNQPPLFDITDLAGMSLSQFAESDFVGSKLFSYATGTGVNDIVLGFPLKYSGSTNFTSDIVFDNNYDADTFRYRQGSVLEDKVSEHINLGYVKQNFAGSNNFLTNYVTAGTTKQFQHIRKTYEGITNYFEIAQPPAISLDASTSLKVYVNNKFLRLQNTETPEYSVEYVNETVAVAVDHNLINKGDVIDIFVYTNQNTNLGFYEIPKNLESNPYNETFAQVSFGQMRNHLERIGENHKEIKGTVFGLSNLRDLDLSVGGSLIQNSASLLPAMAFVTDQPINFFNSIDFACKEYERFKYKFYEATANYLGSSLNAVDIVDEILESFALVKNKDFPWFYSDMVAFGKNFLKTTVRVTNTAQRVYNLNNSLSTAPGNYALLVYVNDRLLTRDIDFQVNANLTITLFDNVFLKEYDVITLREYIDTDGSYIPETPTKLGLFPKFYPEKILDESVGNGIYQLQGHDGSLYPAFNDIRDDIILELERRIYTNIKVTFSNDLLDKNDFTPGKFRITEYSRSEYNSVLGIEFLKWVGENQLDYITNKDFSPNDEWTWNYNQAVDLDGQRLPGYWRGVYRYYYDTERPHSHPWEMLGYTAKPRWWDTHYSWTVPAQRNLLIQAIKFGRILSPSSASYLTVTNPTYARNDIERFVPVDRDGTLLSPQKVLVNGFSSERLGKNFAVGDYGPIESVWARTSNYVFAVQKTLALLKPARYFGILFDTYNNTYRRLGNSSQYLRRGRNVKLSFKDIIINGENKNGTITRSVGYINWIHGYLTSLGFDAAVKLRELIDFSEINLTYRFSGFTDKNYIKILADQVSLTSTSESVVIPDESYNVFLSKSLPLETITYSAVIIEKTSRGYSVTGYDQRLPYFVIIPSRTTGTNYKMEILGQTVTIYEKFFPQKIRIPYGFEFSSVQQVVDFLISYQRYLVAQGIVFDEYDSNLATIKNWVLSVKEFITWSKQGWNPGNILVLSPVNDNVSVYTENYFVDNIDNYVYGSQIIGSNFNVIRNTDFTLIRDNKRTNIKTISGQTIALVRLNLVQFEHVLVLDNTTIFNDVILNPSSGDRQYRVKLVGSVTNAWDGDLTPPGFIYSNGVIDEWISNYDYRKGSIVSYKGINYSAMENLDGSETFNFSKWVALDSVFRQGLAPNFSQNAVKFEEIYDVDNLPSNESLAAYSNSLIGFKPRTFLDNLGITAVSQIKFYQGYIKTKGTKNAVTAFAKGKFDNVDSAIDLYEEWGARLGSYGAIDSNPEYTFIVKNSKYDNDPLLYQFVNTNSPADTASFATLSLTNLLTFPNDYDSKVFLNRNDFEKKSWKIEMFGDSLMCGKKVDSQQYSIDFVSRHGYSIDLQTANQYSVFVTDVETGKSKNFVRNNESFSIVYSSAYGNEDLFLTIEPVTNSDVPLSVTTSTESSSVSTVLPNTRLLASYTSRLPYEKLYVTYEPVADNEKPKTKLIDGSYYYPETVRTGTQGFIRATSVLSVEDLYFTIEEVSSAEFPQTTTAGFAGDDRTFTCINDKTTGRVDEPPDYLLYQFLSNDYDVAITTRSAEGSTSQSLLIGNDGVNGIWPDNIEADIIILNHGLEDAKQGVSINTYKNNLREIRSRVAPGKIVIWQTPGLLDTSNPNTNFEDPGTSNIKLYANAMKDIALENSDYLVDTTVMADYLNYIAVDGIHLTQFGYKEVVNRLLAPTVKQAIDHAISSQNRYYEDDIRTAGYVRTDEVDVQVFDITNYSLFDATLLSSLNTGYKMWVAKDFDHDWQVYRASLNATTIISARGQVNNQLVLTCSTPHYCDVGEMVAIRNLDNGINGFYRITAATEFEFTVDKPNMNPKFAITNRNGVLFDFDKLRFKTLSQVKNYKPKRGWVAFNPQSTVQPISLDKIYVDNLEFNNWKVYTPIKVNTTYKTVFYSNVITANTYSIIGINCVQATSLVSNVNYGEEINFCIFSEDNTEDLYYTIEVATEDDITATPILDGTSITYANSYVEIPTDIYEFELVRSSNPQVDIESIKNLYIYDKDDRNILTRLDMYDPNKGKILGIAREDIDIISDDDPASYRNTDNSTDLRFSDEIYWTNDQIGTYWWRTANCRFVDYEQGDLEYRKANWGKLFPGSQIEVYEWIASDVLPSVYVSQGREGTPLYANDEYYSDSVYVDPDTNTFVSKYFFWVKGITNKSVKNKKSSTASLQDIIANPNKQGIPYITPFRNDAFGVYNVGTYAQTDNAVMYMATKRLLNEKIIHSDFKLLQEGRTTQVFPPTIESKLIDSIAGVDAQGNVVPDPKLGKYNQIGLGLRPRQTLIVNLQEARRNFITYINQIFISHPIVLKIKDNYRIYSDNMFARDPEPNANEYDAVVNYITNIYDPIQTKNVITILVRNDTTYGGFWALYQRTAAINTITSAANSTLSMIRKQSFDVTRLWDYADWYRAGYSKTTPVDHVVETFNDIYKLTLDDDEVIRVKNVSITKITTFGSVVTRNQELIDEWELYRFTRINGKVNLELIGLNNKTVQLKPFLYQPQGFDVGDFDVAFYDSNTLVELRYILSALKEDIFVDELKDEYNQMLFALVDYILTEQKYIDWFFKTSFISVNHRITGLNQLPSLVKDRQTNIESYISEVKPYRTKIREFITSYNQVDNYDLTVTDFDLPSYYDKELGIYRSPNGEYIDIDLAVIQRPEYREWVENHAYTLGEAVIASPGYGFKTSDNSQAVVPSVEVVRTDVNAGKEANVVVEINKDTFGISKAYVIDPGSRFTQTPSIKLIGIGAKKPIDRQKYEFTVVTQGYSYFTVGARNQLGFGLFGKNSRAALEKNYARSKISTLDWTLGSGGTPNYPQNGQTIENQRVYAQDPWNVSSIVWENRPSGNGDADGGWNHVVFSIDPTKTYRSVVWMRRTSNTAGGTLYHGLQTNGTWPAYTNGFGITDGTVRRLVDGQGEWNPYWNYRAAGDYNKDEWYLHVGFIFPHTYTGSQHPTSGIYTRTGGKILNNNGNITDCKFPPNASQAMQRCYHYYCGDNTTRSQFAFPRFEEVDGNEPSIQDLLEYGPYQDVLYNLRQRGYHFHRIRRSDGQVASSQFFDLYSQTTPGFTGQGREDLARELNVTTDDYVVVVHTYDEPSINRLSIQGTSLVDAMLRCGASRQIFTGSTFKFRSGYILVGIPGAGAGRGIEHYAGSQDNAIDAYASIRFKIERGYLAGLESNPKHYVFASQFQLPLDPEPGQSYTYGDKNYVYDGKRWIGTKVFISSLAGNREPGAAVLSPRLQNTKTRKIATTIKFDRVKYTSQVVNWAANVTYFRGNIVSYNGAAYRVITTTANAAVFLSANFEPVASSYFDNANDRIMGFYVPENSNSVPKDLARLVNGINPLYSTYVGSSNSFADTILVGDTFSSNAGISAGNIKVAGGKFVDRLFSHAPEELLPGYVYDSLSIRVLSPAIGTTTTTTQAPVVPQGLTLQVFGQNSNTIEVPYNELGFETTDTFTIGFTGGGNETLSQAITVSVQEKPAGGGVAIVPSSFSLLPGQQQTVTVTATNNMFAGKTWFDLTNYNNKFELLDNSPTWSLTQQGMFTFNGGANVNDRASSVGTMTGINTTPGGFNTVAMWMRWTGDNNGYPMEFKTGYRLWLPNGAFGFNTGGGDLYGISAAQMAMFKNSWIFVTAVFHNSISGSTYTGFNKLYINGTQRVLSQIQGAASPGTAGIGITLGNSSNPSATPDQYEFDGNMTEIYAYNRELSSDEVLSMYFATKERYPGPPTTTTTSTTSTSSTTTTTIPPIPWSLSIVGSSTKASGSNFVFNWTAPQNTVGSTYGYWVVNCSSTDAFTGFAITPGNLGGEATLSVSATSGSFTIPTIQITSGGKQEFQVIITEAARDSTELARSQCVTISGPWSTGYASLPLTKPLTSINYFKFDRVKIIQGDGQADSLDWAIFNFDTDNNGDYDGSADSKSFFGGESVSSGGTGGVATHGAVWGWNTTLGWQLLYVLPLGSGSGNAYNHKLGGWLEVGSVVTSGSGKRDAYNTLEITHVGFAAYTSAPAAFTNGSGTATTPGDIAVVIANNAQAFSYSELPVASTLLTYMLGFGVGPNDSNTG